MTMKIHTLLEANSSHLSDETLERLDGTVQGILGVEPLPVSAYRKAEYGYFVYVGDENQLAAAWDRLPPDLRQVIEVAVGNGCTWVMFDHDGDMVPGVPTYAG